MMHVTEVTLKHKGTLRLRAFTPINYTVRGQHTSVAQHTLHTHICTEMLCKVSTSGNFPTNTKEQVVRDEA